LAEAESAVAVKVAWHGLGPSGATTQRMPGDRTTDEPSASAALARPSPPVLDGVHGAVQLDLDGGAGDRPSAHVGHLDDDGIGQHLAHPAALYCHRPPPR
jgi:hypothetical protein